LAKFLGRWHFILVDKRETITLPRLEASTSCGKTLRRRQSDITAWQHNITRPNHFPLRLDGLRLCEVEDMSSQYPISNTQYLLLVVTYEGRCNHPQPLNTTQTHHSPNIKTYPPASPQFRHPPSTFRIENFYKTHPSLAQNSCNKHQVNMYFPRSDQNRAFQESQET
jgi:hypothetical protein